MQLTIKEIQAIETDMLRDVVYICEQFDIPYYAIYGTLLATIRHSNPIPWDPDIDLYVPENEINRIIEAIEKEFGDKYWVDYRNKNYRPRPFPRIGLKGYKTDVLHIDIFRMSGLPNGRIKQELFTHIGRTLYVIWRAKTVNLRTTYRKAKIKKLFSILIRIITILVPLNMVIKLIDKMCKYYPVFSTDYVGRAMGQGAIYDKVLFLEYIKKPYCDFLLRVPVGYEKLLKKMYGDYMKFPPKENTTIFMNKIYTVNRIDD